MKITSTQHPNEIAANYWILKVSIKIDEMHFGFLCTSFYCNEDINILAFCFSKWQNSNHRPHRPHQPHPIPIAPVPTNCKLQSHLWCFIGTRILCAHAVKNLSQLRWVLKFILELWHKFRPRCQPIQCNPSLSKLEIDTYCKPLVEILVNWLEF